MIRTRAGLGLVLLLATASTACGSQDPNSIAAQARSGDQKGFVAGDGSVRQYAPANRDPALALRGTTLEGAAWDLAQWRGTVVVVNMWGSWCGPCVEEAPQLQKAWTSYSSKRAQVRFIGLDFKEGPEAGRAFERAYGITYPSLAYDDGAPALGLRGLAPTVPTTVVLDKDGQVAARVLGATTATTLSELVDDVLTEG